MTTTEKIEAWITQNTSRTNTGANLREILLELAAGISVGSEQTTGTWTNAENTEIDIEHSLNTMNVNVHIFISAGEEKINPSAYEIFPVDNGKVRVRKTVLGAWTSAKVIIEKLI